MPTTTMTMCALMVCSITSTEKEMSTEEKRSKLIRTVFNEFNKDRPELLDEFYADNVVFEDPIQRLEGLEKLSKYYLAMYENVLSISFDFTDEVSSGDSHVVMWTMNMTVKNFNKEKPVIVHGNSVIRFNESDKVVYHRDYFDMGEMLYEHVPVMGYLVKKALNKIEKSIR